MIVQCDSCQAKFRIDDSKVTEKGVKVKCTKCQNTFVVKPEPAVTPPISPEPPKESPFEISFEPETEPETEPPKEMEMTADEKLAAEWGMSISFEDEKPAEGEKPQKQELGGIETSDTAVQVPSEGGDFSFSFEEGKESVSEKKSAADIKEAHEDKPVFDFSEADFMPPPLTKEEPSFELPSEPAPSEHEIKPLASEETIAELPPLSSLEHGEEMYEIESKVSEKTEKISTAIPEDVSHRGFRLIPLLSITAVIAGIVIFYLTGGISSVSSILSAKAPVSLGKFDIAELKGYYTENESIGKLFIIEGRITSTFDKPQDIIGIKGSIFNSNGESMEEKTIGPGTILSIDDLKTIQKDELEKRFKDRKKSSLPAKGSMPFMIVFSDLSTDPQEYGVELVQ